MLVYSSTSSMLRAGVPYEPLLSSKYCISAGLRSAMPGLAQKALQHLLDMGSSVSALELLDLHRPPIDLEQA